MENYNIENKTLSFRDFDSLSGHEKAAIFIMSLDNEYIKKIIQDMKVEEVKKIYSIINKLGVIDENIIIKVLEEFLDLIGDGNIIAGNNTSITNLFNEILENDTSEYSKKVSIWNKLAAIDHHVIKNYLDKERTVVIAFILSNLEYNKTAQIIELFDTKIATQILLILASIKKVSEKIKRIIEKTIENELLGSSVEENQNKIIGIFENINDDVKSQDILSDIRNYNVKLADNIKYKMFSFNDVRYIDSDGIIEIIKVINKSDMIIALAGTDDNLRKIFLNNMSARAGRIIQDDIENLGKPKINDIALSQTRISEKVKQLIKEGIITINRKQNVEIEENIA
ncbi:MAG: hypothetical protein OEY79_03525 [Anaplasmataceae bacterium]|nr:hypothetical protein [Anaplasmataceae bacterium]